MATLKDLPIKVVGTETGLSRRKVFHELYGVDGAISEDTGRALKTYGMTVICTGDDWELERDAIETVLDTDDAFFVNHPDFGYIRVEVTGYSISETKLKKRFATISISLIESLGDEYEPTDLNDELTLIDKIKAAIAKVKEVMATARRYKGLVVAAIANATGIIDKVLRAPDNLLGFITDASPFEYLETRLDMLSMPELESIASTPFNLIPEPVLGVADYISKKLEYDNSVKVESLIHATIHLKTIAKISSEPKFETLDAGLAFHKALNLSYLKVLTELEDVDLFAEVHAQYLQTWENEKVNLKSIRYFDMRTALLPDFFRTHPAGNFDALFKLQGLQLKDLFAGEYSVVPRRVVYLR